jgi:hypothetical protein
MRKLKRRRNGKMQTTASCLVKNNKRRDPRVAGRWILRKPRKMSL